MKKKKVIALIEDAIAHAKMERASFERPGSYMHQGQPETREEYTNEIREATRLYCDSWIVGPLESALAELRRGDRKPVGADDEESE